MTFLKCFKGMKKRASDISLDIHLFSANRCIGPFLPVLIAPSSSHLYFQLSCVHPIFPVPPLPRPLSVSKLCRLHARKVWVVETEKRKLRNLGTRCTRHRVKEFNLSVKNEGYIYYIYIQLCTGFESLFYPHCFYQLVTHRHTAWRNIVRKGGCPCKA